MNLFARYKELRTKYGMGAKAAYGYVKAEAVTAWRRELRGWAFNPRVIFNNMSDRERTLYVKPIDGNRTVTVVGAYDQDYDTLDGYCRITSRYTDERWQNQVCISHEDGRYYVWSTSEWVVVEFEDAMDTEYYRKRGYAKQPAFERAVASRKKQLDYVERVLHDGNNAYYLKLQLLEGCQDEDDADDGTAKVIAETDSVSCEITEDDDLIDVLEEHWCELLAQLTP